MCQTVFVTGAGDGAVLAFMEFPFLWQRSGDHMFGGQFF